MYPDFIAFIKTENQDENFYILEVKGEHIRYSDDTLYKEELFDQLEKMSQSAVEIGKMSIPNAGKKIILNIVMSKEELAKIISTPPPNSQMGL